MPRGHRCSTRDLSLGELRCAAGSLQAVLLKASGSKTLYLSRFMRVIPLGCPFGCPREAPILVWRLFPLAFYNIAQDDCFFKRQEEEPILFGSSTGYSAFAYMLLNALFTMVDSASGLLYFTLAYGRVIWRLPVLQEPHEANIRPACFFYAPARIDPLHISVNNDRKHYLRRDASPTPPIRPAKLPIVQFA